MPTPILVIIIGQVSSAPFSILVLDRFFTVLSFTHTRTHAHTRARARAYTHTHTHTHTSPRLLCSFSFSFVFFYIYNLEQTLALFSATGIYLSVCCSLRRVQPIFVSTKRRPRCSVSRWLADGASIFIIVIGRVSSFMFFILIS